MDLDKISNNIQSAINNVCPLWVPVDPILNSVYQ